MQGLCWDKAFAYQVQEKPWCPVADISIKELIPLQDRRTGQDRTGLLSTNKGEQRDAGSSPSMWPRYTQADAEMRL